MSDPSLSSALSAILKRELRLAYRRMGDLATPLAFFAIVCTLFPLALSPSRELLLVLGPGVLWVAALLAQLLTAQSLFKQDLDDGSLELIILTGQPIAALAGVKTLAYWLITGVPLVLLSPLLAASYQLPLSAIPTLMLSLTLGTLTLAFLGGLGAAITLAARQGNSLMSLLVLPLAMPILIFGARAVSLAAIDANTLGAIKLLAAACIMSICLLPMAIAAALRIGVD